MLSLEKGISLHESWRAEKKCQFQGRLWNQYAADNMLREWKEQVDGVARTASWEALQPWLQGTCLEEVRGGGGGIPCGWIIRHLRPFPKLPHSQSVGLWMSVLVASLWAPGPLKASSHKLASTRNVVVTLKCFCTLWLKSNNTTRVFLLLHSFCFHSMLRCYNPICPFC